MAGIALDRSPHDRFVRVWHNVHDYLDADPAQARYLAQIEASPYIEEALARLAETDDPLIAVSEELRDGSIDLPITVLWDLSVGPAIRLAADAQTSLDEEQLQTVAEACWRAVSKPD